MIYLWQNKLIYPPAFESPFSFHLGVVSLEPQFKLVLTCSSYMQGWVKLCGWRSCCSCLLRNGSSFIVRTAWITPWGGPYSTLTILLLTNHCRLELFLTTMLSLIKVDSHWFRVNLSCVGLSMMACNGARSTLLWDSHQCYDHKMCKL